MQNPNPKKGGTLEVEPPQVIRRYQKLLIVLEDLEDAGRRAFLRPREHGSRIGCLFGINVGGCHDLGACEIRLLSSKFLKENWPVHPFPHTSTAEKASKIMFKEAHLGVFGSKM